MHDAAPGGKLARAGDTVRERPWARARGAEGATSPEPLRHQGPDGTGVSEVRLNAEAGRQRGRPHQVPLLEAPMDFAVRHIGPSSAEQQHMLAALGYASLDELTTA